MVREEIVESIKKVVREITGLEVDPQLDWPTDGVHGDYSSNIAMVVFKKVAQVSKVPRISQGWKTPLELARKIAEELKAKTWTSETFEKIEAAPPGFINFYLSASFLSNQLKELLKEKKKVDQTPKSLGQKIMVEFAHPNTHKEFHIGHLRNIIIGEVICRLLQSQGAEIFRANYQGDIGLHVAKALHGIQGKIKYQISKIKTTNQKSKIDTFEELEKASLEDRIKFLAEAYILGSKSYEEEEKARREIQQINKQIYQKDPSIMEVWEKTRQWSLDYFDSIYKRVGSYFDRLFFESEVYELGKKIVKDHIAKGIFTRDQGAVIFDGEKYGLHKRVFVTKEGFATYEGKEMGLAFLEFSAFPFDLAIHIVAHEQAGYFKVVFKALELIDPKFKNRQKHLSYGMVELKEGKMASRVGNVITAEWLLDETKSRIKKSFSSMDEETAEKVAVGAVKYSLLKFSPASNVTFSFEESISLEGNSGPYLQYTYARTRSVLAKVKSQKSKIKTTVQNSKIRYEQEEMTLLRLIHRFPEVVGEAANNFAPNLLCNYLFDLAQRFNLFYQKHRVLGSKREEFRLALTEGVGKILKNGLYLLGIEAPERM